MGSTCLYVIADDKKRIALIPVITMLIADIFLGYTFDIITAHHWLPKLMLLMGLFVVSSVQCMLFLSDGIDLMDGIHVGPMSTFVWLYMK